MEANNSDEKLIHIPESFWDNIEPLSKKDQVYSKWLTNVSLGLLGFYLAILVEIRSSTEIDNKVFPIVILSINLIPIIIGFFIRTKTELIEYYDRIRILLKDIISIYENIPKNDSIVYLTNEQINMVEKLKAEKFEISALEKFKNKTTINLIITQFVAFSFTLALIIVYLFGYLF